MKGKQFIIILVVASSVFFQSCIYKNTEDIDSETVLSHIDSLLNKSFDLRRTQPDSAIIYAKDALALSENVFPEEEAKAYRKIGLANYYKKEYNDAIIAYDKAFTIEKRIGNKDGQMASLNLKAKVHIRRDEQEKAARIYLQSLNIGEYMISPSKDFGDACNSLGSILCQTNDFDNAKYYIDKALQARKKQKDNLRLATSYQNMGGIFFRMWEIDSIENHLDSAMANYIESEFLLRKGGHQRSFASVLNNLGGVYFEKKDIPNAIKYFEESLTIKNELNLTLGIANTSSNLCQAYFMNKQNEKSRNYCQMGIAHADTLTDYEVLSNTQHILYKIEKQQKNDDKALSHHEAYSKWNEKLNRSDKEAEIKEIINRHEIEKQKVQTEKQQNMLTTGMLSALIMALGLFFYSQSKKKLHQEEKKRRLQEEQLRKETEGRRIEEQKLYNQVIKTLEKDAEINAVNAEIDAKLQERTKVASALHDSVCSGLVSARMHFESVKNNITSEDQAVFVRGFGLLNEAYEICREISHDLSPPMLAKFGLAPAIEDLCEKLSTPQTQLQFNATPFEERLDHQQELTLYQSIQELLQNILKHSSAAEAHVQLTDHGGSLNILVEDDGKGFDTAAIADGGIGLQRISTRVKHLGGSMDVDSSPGNGTTVIIDVPKILVPENQSIS